MLSQRQTHYLIINYSLFKPFSTGFTSLCEKYSNLSTCGTDELSATLNNYIGKIVEGK
jgi:hypothetical protein